LVQPGIDLSIHVPPAVELTRWPAEVEAAAFMVVREAVENAFRHASASAISIRLDGTAGALQVTVADNGVGITDEAPNTDTHLGLLGMRERGRAVGAAVTVERADTRGTQVIFDWKGAL
jgi:signal transduction histidine kinase